MTINVLILCTHNSARSVLSEGMLNHLAQKLGKDVRAFSAGSAPSGRLNPFALKESNGFFVRYDPQLKMKPDGTYERARPPIDTGKKDKKGRPIMDLGPTVPQNRIVAIAPQNASIMTVDNDGKPSEGG